MPLRSTGRLIALLPLLLMAACGGPPPSPTEAPAAPALPTTAAELPPTEAPAPAPTAAAAGAAQAAAPAAADAASESAAAPASVSAPDTAAYQPTLAENEPAALAAAEAGAIGRPTLVWFHADWCHVCQEIKPAVHAMRADYQDRVAIVKLDIDQPDSREAVAKHRVQGTPTFVLFDRDGRTLDRFTGWPGDAQVAALLDQAAAVQ